MTEEQIIHTLRTKENGFGEPAHKIVDSQHLNINLNQTIPLNTVNEDFLLKNDFCWSDYLKDENPELAISK